MRYFIYHPQPGTLKPKEVECKSYKDAEVEYKRLQELYPSRELVLVAKNEYGDKTTIHFGRWI